MKLGIIGYNKDLDTYSKFKTRINNILIKRNISYSDIKVLVSGGYKCTYAHVQRLAKEKGIPTKMFYNKYYIYNTYKITTNQIKLESNEIIVL